MTDILKNIVYLAKRFKLATSLHLFGLVVAFATFYLLMTQILYQKNYNHGLENHERLYRLDSNYIYKNIWDYTDDVCQCFAEALRKFPQVESLTLFESSGTHFTYKKENGEYRKYEVIGCSPKAISTFREHALDSLIKWKDNDPNDTNGLIIPASIAKDYFGTIYAAGDTMRCVKTDSLRNEIIIPQSVRGVYEDFPENSVISNCIYERMEESYKYSLYAQYKCYVKFANTPDDHTLETLGGKLKQHILEYINENIDEFKNNVKNLDGELETLKTTNFRFAPLDESFFQRKTHTTGESGFELMLYILELAFIFIIVIATITFLNFTLAESPTRVRSLHTHLVLGAERKFLRLCVVAECIILAVVTCLIGLAVCWVLSPAANASSLIVGSVAIKDHWLLAMFMVGLAVIIGIVASLYPAIFATSFAPAKVLKGTFGLTSQGIKLRTVLLSVQLFITMLIFIYVGILYLQNYYIFKQPYGFDKNNLLYADLQYISPLKATDLKKQLLQIPGIDGVSFADNLLAGTNAHYEVQKKHRGHPMEYYYIHTDEDYLRTMGIKIIEGEGRDFSTKDSAAIIINEVARKQWPWLKLGDKIPTDDLYADSVTIIGVCENIRYGTMLVNFNQPFGFILNQKDYMPFVDLLARVADGANLEDIRQQANLILKENYSGDRGDNYELMSYDDCVSKSYETELRFFNQMYLIAIFSLGITLIGLFCLTMFETEYRRKEIGIRKVAGATTSEIVWMLCKRYSLLILLCYAVAAPISWYYGNQTLNFFNDRASINWWIFPLSLLLIGGIMLGTVVLQSWSAARENPSNSIKTE